MAGVGVGYWSPEIEIGDVDAFVARIIEICGPTSIAFPFTASPVKDPDSGLSVLSYAVVTGHVPIHIDRRNAAESAPAMFMFVLAAENRPVLLAREATKDAAEAVFMPEKHKTGGIGFGAVELWAGRAVHFDITKHFHGITGYPTGDPIAELPFCVMLQVPWVDQRDIAGALNSAKSTIMRDERFRDLTHRPRTAPQTRQP